MPVNGSGGLELGRPHPKLLGGAICAGPPAGMYLELALRDTRICCTLGSEPITLDLEHRSTVRLSEITLKHLNFLATMLDMFIRGCGCQDLRCLLGDNYRSTVVFLESEPRRRNATPVRLPWVAARRLQLDGVEWISNEREASSCPPLQLGGFVMRCFRWIGESVLRSGQFYL